LDLGWEEELNFCIWADFESFVPNERNGEGTMYTVFCWNAKIVSGNSFLKLKKNASVKFKRERNGQIGMK
jgi:hypothetical protein